MLANPGNDRQMDGANRQAKHEQLLDKMAAFGDVERRLDRLIEKVLGTDQDPKSEKDCASDGRRNFSLIQFLDDAGDIVDETKMRFMTKLEQLETLLF